MLSPKYSSLVDVLKFAYYNYHMDESTIIDLLAIETIAPKRRIARSPGAIYITLIVFIIACMSIGNLLYVKLNIPRLITQPIGYIFIAICGYYLYRRHFLCYRYTLTNETFAIEQIGGNTGRTIAAISVNEITKIQDRGTRLSERITTARAALPPLKQATWIVADIDGKKIAYLVSISEAFSEKLQETSMIRPAQNPAG